MGIEINGVDRATEDNAGLALIRREIATLKVGAGVRKRAVGDKWKAASNLSSQFGGWLLKHFDRVGLYWAFDNLGWNFTWECL